jgi:hypothetical protein
MMEMDISGGSKEQSHGGIWAPTKEVAQLKSSKMN